MKSFNVFSDGDGEYKAIKQGWCWPAFFFGSIWALFSGLWLTALLLLPIGVICSIAGDFVLSVAGNSADGLLDPYGGYDDTTRLVVLAIFSIPLVIRVVVGASGNKWRARKLRRLSFSHVGRFKAENKEHAISLYKAEPSAPARQHAEPVTAKAPSVSPPTTNEHARSERPVGLVGEPRSEKAASQGFPPNWLAWSIAALSILAVADMPYGYYQLLRLLVTGYTGYLAALYFARRSNSWAWVFAFTALVYNPIFVITMSKEFHAMLNFMVAAAITWEIKKLRGMPAASHQSKVTH